MTIMCLSLSYRSVPAEVLEKLAVPARELGEVLARLHAVPGIDEVVVLSTCNRVEVYAAVSGPAGRVTGPCRAVAGLLGARGRIPADEVLAMARIRVGGAAAEHLFSVACGLDSMAVGEGQIVAQVKAAVPHGRRGADHRPGRHWPDRRGAAGQQAGPHADHASAPKASRWPGPAWTSPPRIWAASPPATRSCSGPAARASSWPSCSARPASGGCPWPAAVRCAPPRWPRRWAAGPCGPPTCRPRWPTPISWSPPPGPPRPSCPPGRCGRPGRRPAAGRCSSWTWACHPTSSLPWDDWPGSRSPTSPRWAST